MPVRLTTLGTVRVFRGEEELRDLPAQRLRLALLVYLAVERDVSREAVLSMFWPERDDARGRHALRQMLYELRQVLGEDWIEMRRDRIIATIEVDASTFDAAVQEGRTDDALPVYGGAFLLGFSLENHSFEAWADRRRSLLGRLYRRIQREHIVKAAATGDAEVALAAARRWVELDPLEDEAAHALIERLAAAGQRAAALQYYETYVQQLRSELDVEPLEQTQALVAAIRAGDAIPQHIEPTTQPTDQPQDAEPTSQVDAAQHIEQPLRERGDRPEAASVPVAARTEDRQSRRRSRLLRGIAAGVVIAVLIGAGFAVMRPTRRPLVADRPVTIAILPLSDRSSDAQLVALTQALTDALAHGLAQSRFFKVIPPNGVLLLREQGTAEDSVGRLLGADYLVGGSVSRDQEDVHLGIELLDGTNGTVVYSQIVSRPWSESRILVEDVVREAATLLRGEVGAQVNVARVRAHTDSEQAWRYLLEGNAIVSGTVGLVRAGELAAAEREHARADSLYALAAEADQNWAEPVMLRGRLLERRAFLTRFAHAYASTGVREMLDSALRLSSEAIERDSMSSGSWTLRGTLLQGFGQAAGDTEDAAELLADAEAALRRATSIDSLNQSAFRALADLLYNEGRYNEALVAADRAYQIDYYAPVMNIVINRLFTITFELGEDDQAEGWCFDGRRRFPDDLPYLYCLLALHAWADGIEPDPGALRMTLDRYEQTRRRLQPELVDRFELMIAAAHARAGNPDSARAILRRTMSNDPGQLWIRASVHLALGEDSAAVALLNEYFAAGGPDGPRIARSRPFWRLQRDPDLARLIASPR